MSKDYFFIICGIRMTSARNIADSDADVKIHADTRRCGSGAPIHLYLRYSRRKCDLKNSEIVICFSAHTQC